MIEHGEYTVKVEGAIITATFIGTFNDLASKNVCEEVEAIIKQMNGAGFCMLLNMLAYEGSTPEAHIIGDQHFQWVETQNCLGRATVVTNSFLIDVSRSEQASLQKSHIASQMFETEEAAKAWLVTLIK